MSVLTSVTAPAEQGEALGAERAPARQGAAPRGGAPRGGLQSRRGTGNFPPSPPASRGFTGSLLPRVGRGPPPRAPPPGRPPPPAAAELPPGLPHRAARSRAPRGDGSFPLPPNPGRSLLS